VWRYQIVEDGQQDSTTRLIRFAIGISLIAVSAFGSAVAHSQVEPPQVIGQETLTNQPQTPVSEMQRWPNPKITLRKRARVIAELARLTETRGQWVPFWSSALPDLRSENKALLGSAALLTDTRGPSG
jgi:hypothetical protein